MSEAVRNQDCPEIGDDSSLVGAANTRVDAPHVASDATPIDPVVALSSEPARGSASAAAEGAGSGEAAVQIVQQVRAQASQLADHLRRQQAAVDHREAELNARVCAMETQFRNGRLWLVERQSEFAEMQADLDRRQRELEARASEIAEADAASQTLRETTEQELRSREAALETREAVLATRLIEIAAANESSKQTFAKAKEHLRQQESALGDRETELNRTKAWCLKSEKETEQRLVQLEARCHQLDAAESILADEQAELQRAREVLHAEHVQWQEDVESMRHKLQEERQQFVREMEKKKQILKRRRDDLDARNTAVKQLRGEVARTQRETLELRLATEELWARLCGTMAPAALTQSLGQLRLKMADQNRLAQADLAEQRTELQSLGARLAEQHEKVTAQRKDLQDWVTRRTSEIEQQAAVLVAREQELDRQDSEMQQTLKLHNEERRSYQQEIRRLLRQLRQEQSAAA